MDNLISLLILRNRDIETFVEVLCVGVTWHVYGLRLNVEHHYIQQFVVKQQGVHNYHVYGIVYLWEQTHVCI